MSKDEKRKRFNRFRTYQDIKKEFIGIVNALGYKHNGYEVFEDFLIMYACAISNSVDPLHRKEREAMFLERQAKYDKDERECFVKLIALLVEGLDRGQYSADMLGEIYHELNFQNSAKGQFFTPIEISRLMAQISLNDCEKQIKSNGFITVCDSTCGSGAMVIAAANIVAERSQNPSEEMCALAVDKDLKCAMMTYIQLSLLGIPAVVVHGDSLIVEEYARFYTPIYLLGGWLWRKNLSIKDGICEDDEKLRCIFEPLYYLLKYKSNQKGETK